jgi:hypothetical protein
VLPANFFSILASGTREVYVEALMLLHRSIKYELNIRVDDYVAQLVSILEDKNFVPDEDDAAPSNEGAPSAEGAPSLDGGGLSLNAKARLILERLVKTGWVEREILDGSFTEIITPRDYAIKVLQLLNELTNSTVREYNSLVFATYSGLKQAKDENRQNMYEAVLSAASNTERLTYELKTLYHGIRRYIKSMQAESDVNELLENQFEKYKRMADRIYHPIKTMDSIHRYKTHIEKMLADILSDDDILAEMKARAMSVRKYEHEEDAKAEIGDAIDTVLDAYRSIGSMVNEIDRKNTSYTKSSIEKIKYLMTADQSITGKLVDMLKAYAQGNAGRRERLGGLFEARININRQEFFDSKSLYHKNVSARRINTTPLEIADAVSSALDAAGAEMLLNMRKLYPASRIRDFVNKLFESISPSASGAVSSEAIVLEGDSDFVLLILALLRAGERDMRYHVRLQGGTIMRNGYRIPKMTIEKTTGGNNVEQGGWY